MCVSPVKIPNPNYGCDVPLIVATVDTESQYIEVPCGVCIECQQMRQMSLVQRCRVMALDHYIYFCTLTYNNESLPILSLSNGVDVPYADRSDVQKMMKRIRKSNAFSRPFKYFFVSERGKKGRPHFHGLIFIPKSKDDDSLTPAVIEQKIFSVLFSEWKRNYGSNRVPDWKPLFTFHSKWSHGKLYRNFDLHYVVPHSTEHGAVDVAFYVTKYLLKGSKHDVSLQQAMKLNLSQEEYDSAWKIVRSKSFASIGFGASTDLEKDFVKSCFDKSSNNPDGFVYYSDDGSTQPLSKYYRKFLSPENAIRSFKARNSKVSDSRSLNDKLLSVEKGAVIRSKVDDRDISIFYPD